VGSGICNFCESSRIVHSLAFFMISSDGRFLSELLKPWRERRTFTILALNIPSIMLIIKTLPLFAMPIVWRFQYQHPGRKKKLRLFLKKVIAVMGRQTVYFKYGGADLGEAVRLLGEWRLATLSIDEISHAVANILKPLLITITTSSR
jgi:hypothetical protein